MITKEKFTQYINFIQFRLDLIDDDTDHKEIRAILKKIQKSFPKDSQNHCEIHHYIFDLNFGKPTQDSEYETPEQLYERLINYNSD